MLETRTGDTRIVVSGAPAAGKSTVAARLASELKLPLLSLDDIKEAVADVLGTGGEDWSNQVGDAAAEVIFRLAPSFPGVVVEGWWRRERRDRAKALFDGWHEVFCMCDPALAERRARNRVATSRHSIHRDVINPALLDEIANAVTRAEPLDLGAILVTIDTSIPVNVSELAHVITRPQ